MRTSSCRFLLLSLILVLSFGILLTSPKLGAASGQNKIYVTAWGADNVRVIDSVTNSVIATIPTGHNPHGIAITPNGASAYVSNVSSDSVTVIDTTNDTAIATVPVGITPAGVAVAPNGSRVYVANINSHDVTVIDTATNTVVTNIAVGTEAFQLAVSPDGSLAYVTAYQQTVANEPSKVLDLTTNTVAATIPVALTSVAFTSDGLRAYGTTWTGSAIAIDTSTQAVVATIPFGSQSSGMAITPNDHFVYATDSTGNNVAVISTDANSVLGSIPAGQLPMGLAFVADGTRAYVANSGVGSDDVSVVDTSTNTVLASIPLGAGSRPIGIAIKGINLPSPLPCDGQNYMNNSVLPNADTCTGGAMIGISWVPVATETISRIEVFTGFPNGIRQPNRLAIWSDDGGSPSRPLVSLAATCPFDVVPTRSWQGANLLSPLAVIAGQRYWVVWDPDVAQVCSSSFDPSGTHLTYWASTSGTVDGGASWIGPFGQPFNNQPVDRWKFRVFCDTGGGFVPADAGPDQAFCENSSATLTGNAPPQGAGTWSIVSGSGSIVSPNSPTTQVNGLGYGDNTFRWTIPDGACGVISDTVVIRRDQAPVANAGPDQAVCESTTATLSGNPPTVGVGTWEVLGGGSATILDPHNPNAGVTNLSYGSNFFRWTITNGQCSSDDVVGIDRHQTPTSSNAGPDQTLCETSTATLAGNAPTSGTASWELVSGVATITDPSSPTTTVTDLGYGPNLFKWRISNGSCGVSEDFVLITRNHGPCNDSQLTALGPAKVWLGLKNSDDVGTKFDLLAEVLKNGQVVGSGQLNNVPGGSSGFNNAVARLIGLSLSGPIGLSVGDTVGIRLSVRIAEGVSGHRSGIARLWFNDAAADTNCQMTISGSITNRYLKSGFQLILTPGAGPKNTVDVFVDRAVGGNPFKPFGTWTFTF